MYGYDIFLNFLLMVVPFSMVVFMAMVWASIIIVAQTVMGTIFKGMSRYMVKPLKKKYIFLKKLFSFKYKFYLEI